MKTIELTNGGECKVDDCDYKLVAKHKWHKSPNGYVVGSVNGIPTKIHRLIMILNEIKVDIDHINMDKLDNRKENLRICSRSQNMANSKSRGGSSKYKGVSWSKDMKKWVAYLMKDYKEIYREFFILEEEAAKAYDKKAKEVFGEFARTNFE